MGRIGCIVYVLYGGRVSAGRRVVHFCNVGWSTGRYMSPGTD